MYKEHRNRYEVTDGDLGFGRVASIGKVIRLRTDSLPYAISPTLAVIKPLKIHNNYLQYFLQGSQLNEQIGALLTGTTRSSLGIALLRALQISYPEVTEQQLIGNILSQLDRAIEQTEAIIAKQQRIKTGLMQDLLTKGIDEQGNIRSEATHEFKDSPLGRIPVGWEAKLLDDCVKSDAPICYGILMPGTGVDDGVPVIKVKDIFGGVICLDNILLTDPRIDAAYKRSRLRQGDLLVTIRGTTGRVAVVPAVLDGGNITQDTARIRLNNEYHSSFFFYVLQSEKVQSQVDLQTLGQAVKGINIADVRKLRVPTPHPDEQLRICRILDGINTDWQANVCCKDKLNLQKIGLMRDLLTGKVRVTNLLPTQATHG